MYFQHIYLHFWKYLNFFSILTCSKVHKSHTSSLYPGKILILIWRKKAFGNSWSILNGYNHFLFFIWCLLLWFKNWGSYWTFVSISWLLSLELVGEKSRQKKSKNFSYISLECYPKHVFVFLFICLSVWLTVLFWF